MALTFQEFAIAWSQPPNKTRCTASWETTPCLAWSLPWQPSCCAFWWLWSDGKKCCHVIILKETLRKAGWTFFFWGEHGSMAGWPLSMVRWWAGLERDYHLGDLLGRDVGAIYWWPDVILEPSPSISGGTRLLAQNGPRQESHWRSTSVPWTLIVKLRCSLVICFVANLWVYESICPQFPHPHGNEKWHHLYTHGLWDHIERTFAMCSGYTWQDPTRRDMRRGRYVNCTRAEIYSSSHGIIQGLAQAMTCWNVLEIIWIR